MRRESKFDKMRELEWKHDTPVGWISKRKSTIEMNEIANNPLEKRNKEYYENLKVAKT